MEEELKCIVFIGSCVRQLSVGFACLGSAAVWGRSGSRAGGLPQSEGQGFRAVKGLPPSGT